MARSVLLWSVFIAFGATVTANHGLLEERHRLRRFADTGVAIDWNQLLDGVFLLAQQQIIADNKDELSIPDVSETFERKVGFLKLRGSFSATNGFVNSLSSLHRTGEISLSHEGESIALTSHLGLKVLRVRYDNYRAEILGASTRGEISASVASNSVRSVIKFTLRDDGCSVNLEEVKIVDLGRFDVHITGLGALDWLASKIAMWVTDNKREVIKEKLEQALAKEIRKALGKFNCDQYYLQIREQLMQHLGGVNIL